MRFRQFILEAMQTGNLHLRIPLSDDIFVLSRVFNSAGYELRVVGGAVRDYLIRKYEVEEKIQQGLTLDQIKEDFRETKSRAYTPQGFIDEYHPKDVDLATDAKPQEMVQILKKAGMKDSREQGAAFGVIIAHLPNGHEYEIASYREEAGYSDGRHPDSVSFSTAKNDYKRRDFTINALFYTIPNSPEEDGEVVDYGGGQGLEDVKTKSVRPIGRAADRFEEDKLRVLRLVRFITRYHDTMNIASVIDSETRRAVELFKDVRGHGVSGERIYNEFMSGFLKSKNTQAYLKAYRDLGLLETVFPGLKVDLSDMQRIGVPGVKEDPYRHRSKNPVVVLSWILRKAGNPTLVRDKLNQLNWPNEIADEVAYLLRLWGAGHDELPGLSLKMHPDRRQNVQHLASIMGSDAHLHDPRRKDVNVWQHFSNYEPELASGEDLMQQGFVGPQIGAEQRRLLQQHFNQSYNKYSGGTYA